MDSLLKADGSRATASANVMDTTVSENFEQRYFEENETSAIADTDPEVESMFLRFFLAGSCNKCWMWLSS